MTEIVSADALAWKTKKTDMILKKSVKFFLHYKVSFIKYLPILSKKGLVSNFLEFDVRNINKGSLDMRRVLEEVDKLVSISYTVIEYM